MEICHCLFSLEEKTSWVFSVFYNLGGIKPKIFNLRKAFRIFGTFFYYNCLFMCLIKGKNM